MADSRYAFDRISSKDVNDLLTQYPSFVPEKLTDLEEQRMVTLPAKVAERRKEGKAYLTKQEVASLVDWKLSHGTFRPSLKALVQQNSGEFILEVTEQGLADDNVESALKTLTKLRGIGPATAALLLSIGDPGNVPFFSDELFRWAFWTEQSAGGWDRKIKYSAKEYRELLAKVTELRERLGKAVSALDVEKAAYVLGNRALDLSADAKQALPEVEAMPGLKRATSGGGADGKPAKLAKKSKASGKREIHSSLSPPKASARKTRSSKTQSSD